MGSRWRATEKSKIGETGLRNNVRHTPIAIKSVKPIDPKYTRVKGKRGSERRCLIYTTGPIRMAHDARNKADPMDHLSKQLRKSQRIRFKSMSPFSNECGKEEIEGAD